MNGYLLDTHIWLWYLRGAAELQPSLRRLIDAHATRRWRSPISIWEAGMLVARGRLQLEQSFQLWLDDSDAALPLREAEVNREVAALTPTLDLEHRDPADRILAATALIYDLTLVTVDERLAGAKWLPTRSR